MGSICEGGGHREGGRVWGGPSGLQGSSNSISERCPCLYRSFHASLLLPTQIRCNTTYPFEIRSRYGDKACTRDRGRRGTGPPAGGIKYEEDNLVSLTDRRAGVTRVTGRVTLVVSCWGPWVSVEPPRRRSHLINCDLVDCFLLLATGELHWRFWLFTVPAENMSTVNTLDQSRVRLSCQSWRFTPICRASNN